MWDPPILRGPALAFLLNDASASISTRASGSISRATWTMVVAGRIDFEELAVDLADLAPVLDVRDVDPRADDVGGLAAQGLDGGDDDLQGPAGLRLEGRPESAVGLQAQRSGYEDEIPRTDRTRITDHGLPGRARRHVLPPIPLGDRQFHVGSHDRFSIL